MRQVYHIAVLENQILTHGIRRIAASKEKAVYEERTLCGRYPVKIQPKKFDHEAARVCVRCAMGVIRDQRG
jgi:hypothetical protein